MDGRRKATRENCFRMYLSRCPGRNRSVTLAVEVAAISSRGYSSNQFSLCVVENRGKGGHVKDTTQIDDQLLKMMSELDATEERTTVIVKSVERVLKPFKGDLPVWSE